jgi:GT2 family glycosyltransferase
MPDKLMPDKSSVSPRVAVVLLNWNGWRDTVECLESVFRSAYSNFHVVVCDNASSDNSLAHIKAWAEGTCDVWSPPENLLRAYSFPPIQKPISFQEYTRQQAESGGGKMSDAGAIKLTLIQTGANRGFAGGNNVALRYVMARNDTEFIWLLNSDTVVQPDALRALVEKMMSDGVMSDGVMSDGVMSDGVMSEDRVGMCGSTLFYYHEPTVIQTLGGGTFSHRLALPKHIGAQKTVSNHKESFAQLTEPLDYVMGASMMVSKKFLCDVGLMSEAYFLYYEEIDWATRAKGKFRLGYAPESVVYHKSGQSVGNTSETWSATSVYYMTRSRILFSKKFYPRYTVWVYLHLMLSMVNQFRKGKWSQAKAIGRACWNTLRS